MLPDGPHKPAMLAALRRVMDDIAGEPLAPALEATLNGRYGVGSEAYRTLSGLLLQGVEEGWAAYAPIGDDPDYRRGRIQEPCEETHQISVESGLLRDVKGQYHRHTTGEINMIIPIDPDGAFCGQGAGWKVFAPMSEHYPTVTGGKVLIMYLLPQGRIEYCDPPAP